MYAIYLSWSAFVINGIDGKRGSYSGQFFLIARNTEFHRFCIHTYKHIYTHMCIYVSRAFGSRNHRCSRSKVISRPLAHILLLLGALLAML